jgi:hypothetical protein
MSTQPNIIVITNLFGYGLKTLEQAIIPIAGKNYQLLECNSITGSSLFTLLNGRAKTDSVYFLHATDLMLLDCTFREVKRCIPTIDVIQFDSTLIRHSYDVLLKENHVGV